ncbi:hypothetical protein [Arthrobacter sp. UYCu723]
MDYQLQHQAPGLDSVEDGSAATLDNLEPVMPDIYAMPHLYVHGAEWKAAFAVAKQLRGRPHAEVRIFRAVPQGVDVINTGDWVTTSLDYARQHAIQDDEPANDWPVLTALVTAGELVNEGDLCEYGYAGPAIAGLYPWTKR